MQEGIPSVQHACLFTLHQAVEDQDMETFVPEDSLSHPHFTDKVTEAF